MKHKRELKHLVEPGIWARLNDSHYLIECVDPRTLVTCSRLDIGFRTLYLELRRPCPSLAEEIYHSDIRAQSLGTLVDPDNSGKTNFTSFKSVFDEVAEDIKRNGFNPSKTLIPVSSAGSILNGGHRLSSALHFNKPVWVLRTQLPAICCDYDYFYQRSVPNYIIEFGVSKLIEYAQNVHIAFLWSSGEDNWAKSEKLFSNILYRKDLKLTFQGAFNLLYQCYHHMDWIGTKDNGLSGIQQKRLECFPSSLTVRVIIFQEPMGLDSVRNIKIKIRQINKCGYSSVHITDTDEEVQRLSQYILNENSWHFLNYATKRETYSVGRLQMLKAAMVRDGVRARDMVVDGSFVFEAYGLRKAQDLDILVSDAVDNGALRGWERHDNELMYHDIEKCRLLYDPRYHLWVDGIKVISLRQMVAFKKRRGEEKDIVDVESANALVANGYWRSTRAKFKQYKLYGKLRARRRAVACTQALLRFFGVYTLVRAIWHRARGM